MSNDKASLVEHKLRTLQNLLLAYPALDLKAEAEIDGLSIKDFSALLPTIVANNLTEELSNVMLGSNSVGQFIANAVSGIAELVESIASFKSFFTDKQLIELAKHLSDYQSSPAGSVLEQFSLSAYTAIVEDIDQKVLALSPNLFSAFVDDDNGFGATAVSVLNEDEDESDNEDAENDVSTTEH